MANKILKFFQNSTSFTSSSRLLFNFVRRFNAQGQTTVDDEEVYKFSQACNEFWDINGPFQALHTMNRMRISLIKDAIKHGNGNTIRSASKPLKDKDILDIGCGGGILSEPLARLGANVTGIDASREAISVAQYHAKHDPEVYSQVNYKCMTAEELLKESKTFDVVVASEVIEHVSDQELFVQICSQLMKPRGSLILTTVNRTLKSYLLAIVGAEYVLGVIQRGTHDWEKFVPDDELASLIISNGCTIHSIQGMFYNPFTRRWSEVDDTDINYAVVAHKESAESSGDQATKTKPFHS